MFCYDENPKSTGFVNVHELDPNVQWKRHLENHFYLSFIARNSDDWQEKRQVELELAICERKLAYWAKTADRAFMAEATNELKKLWG